MQTDRPFFLFNEYINFDKKSYGPIEHIPLLWQHRHLHKIYFMLTLPWN